MSEIKGLGINNTYEKIEIQKNSRKNVSEPEKEVKEKDKNSQAVKYEKTVEEKDVTYKNPKAENAKLISQLKEESERRYQSLINLVESLLKKQGIDIKLVKEGKFEGTVEIDEETRAQAAAAIAEDGEFGVKAVSDRIVDFAKALSGGDKSKLPILRDAIKQGFEAAKEFLGGELPEISQKTYDEIMRKLDEWEKENPSDTPVAE